MGKDSVVHQFDLSKSAWWKLSLRDVVWFGGLVAGVVIYVRGESHRNDMQDLSISQMSEAIKAAVQSSKDLAIQLRDFEKDTSNNQIRIAERLASVAETVAKLSGKIER